MSLAVVTLEDRQAVYALLGRYLDWLPPTRLSTPRTDTAAPGAGRWRRCQRCAGTGRVLGEGKAAKPCRQPHQEWPHRHGCRPCLNCADGRIAMDQGSDLMLEPGKHELDTRAQEKAEKRRYVDAQLVKLAAIEAQREGRRVEGVDSAELRLPTEAAPDDWTRAHEAKQRQWRTGSYPALERALELLALSAPLRMEALRVYVIEQHFPPDREVRAHMDAVVDWLAARMPRPILLPGDAQAEVEAWKHSLQHGRTPAHAEQRRVRNEQIVELREVEEWTLRRIGRTFGLSHEAVRVILVEQQVAARIVASGPAA